MTTPSNAAKAAALLYHTSGVPDAKTAVQIYDELDACAKCDDLRDEWDAMIAVLDKHSTPVYSALEHMSIGDWWDNCLMLARSIDGCRVELS